mgnify:CR=1 FL=1
MLTAFLSLTGVAAAASLLSVGLYWKDKRAAGRGEWRTAERTLHMAAVCGGWPGALFAQRRFRHKTRDRSFRRIFWCTVVVHLAVVVTVLYFAL